MPNHSQLHILRLCIVFMQFWGYMGIPLGMSGDQVGMNGDEGGRGWGGTKKRRIFMDDLLKTKDLLKKLAPNCTELEQNLWVGHPEVPR